VGNERIGTAVPDFDRLVDEVVGLGRLLSDGVNRLLEDVSLLLRRQCSLSFGGFGSRPGGMVSLLRIVPSRP
jgi:hypothetical protein